MAFRSDNRTGLDVYKPTDMTEVPPDFAGSGGGGGGGGKELPSVWAQYNQKAESFDSDLIEDAKNTVEVLLIFAGLFSGVITAFLSQTYSLLQPDPRDTLTAILNELKGTGSTTPDTNFVPSHSAIRVNCFLVVGLFTSMLVALLAILVKEWVRSYQRDLEGVSSAHLRARIRHFRYVGVERWHFTHIVGLLSVFMNFALFVSAIGIIDLYLSTYSVVGYVAVGIFACGIILFAFTTFFPLFAPDAPFRTPFSTLIMDINRSLYGPFAKRWRRRDNKEKKKDELDDYIDQSQGAESQENSVMRKKLHLDLDILSHLLGAADKSTERWILDMCFEKLPQLGLLAKENPSLIINRDILLEVYGFLANGCIITNKHDRKELDSNRAQRARRLCKFIAWFLSLRRTEEERKKIEEILTDQFTDPLNPFDLPKVIVDDTLSKDSSTVVAYSALGRLEHLYVRVDTPQCDLCKKSAAALHDKVAQQSGKNLAVVRDITEFLVKRADCLLFWNWAEESNWQEGSSRGQMRDLNASAHLALIIDSLRAFTLSVKEAANLTRIVDEKGANAAGSLHRDWFEPLSSFLGKFPTRNPSTFVLGRPNVSFNQGTAPAPISTTTAALAAPTPVTSGGRVIPPAIRRTPPPGPISLPVQSVSVSVSAPSPTPPAEGDTSQYYPLIPPSRKGSAFAQDSVYSDVTSQTDKTEYDDGSPVTTEGVTRRSRSGSVPVPSKKPTI